MLWRSTNLLKPIFLYPISWVVGKSGLNDGFVQLNEITNIIFNYFNPLIVRLFNVCTKCGYMFGCERWMSGYFT